MGREKNFPVGSPEFDEKEEALVKALYEASDGTYSSYTLHMKLNPAVPMGTEEAGKSFGDVRDTTERLIARSLVTGKRLTGADGVYFEKLKLTPKGEKKAIESKNRLRQVTVRRVGDPED